MEHLMATHLHHGTIKKGCVWNVIALKFDMPAQNNAVVFIDFMHYGQHYQKGVCLRCYSLHFVMPAHNNAVVFIDFTCVTIDICILSCHVAILSTDQAISINLHHGTIKKCVWNINLDMPAQSYVDAYLCLAYPRSYL